MALTTYTAWQAVFRQNNQLPADVKTVMVVGAAGGVGSMAIQLLKARTCATVIATASRPETADWCRKMGADHVLDHKKDIPAQLKHLDLINIDMVFSVNGLKDSIRWIPAVIRPYGYLSLVDLKDAVDLSVLMTKSVTVFMEMVFTRSVFDYQHYLVAEVLTELLKLIEDKKIVYPGTLLLKGLTEDNILKSHTLLEKGGMVGKIVIEI